MWRKGSSASIICIFLCAIGGGRAGGEPESCEGLDNIGNSALLECQRSDDCLSLDCDATSLAGFGAVLLLHPCDKPPAIELFFKTPLGLSPVGKFDSSDPIRTAEVPLSNIAEFEITVSWMTNQTVSISSRVVSFISTTVIEPTSVTLPMCMPAPRPATTCLALQQIADASDEELTCTTNDEIEECDTLTCSVTINNIPVTTTLTVLPCGDIPAVHVTIEASGSVLVDEELSESQELTILENVATADVTLNQLDGAIGIQVDVTTVGGVIQPFKYTEVPINRSQCDNISSTQNTTTPSISDAVGKPESCKGLDNIIDTSSALQCQKSDDCLSLDCNATGMAGSGAVLLLHPCDRPPAIELFFKTPDGLSPVGKFDSSDPIRTTGAPLMEGVEFQITVSWITNQTVSLSSRVVRDDVTLYTVIEPTNVTLPMCMPASRPSATCLALQQIANASDEELKCTTNEEIDACDTLTCTPTINGIPVTTTLTVLPCGDIPAVHVTIEAFGNVIVDKELSESQEITILENLATADVTLNQLDGAIGIQVDVISVRGVIQPFKYTEIPIDRSQCDNISSTQDTTMPSISDAADTQGTTMNSDAMILMSLPHAFLMVLSLFHQLL